MQDKILIEHEGWGISVSGLLKRNWDVRVTDDFSTRVYKLVLWHKASPKYLVGELAYYNLDGLTKNPIKVHCPPTTFISTDIIWFTQIHLCQDNIKNMSFDAYCAYMNKKNQKSVLELLNSVLELQKNVKPKKIENIDYNNIVKIK
ncbi:MAG: hypothetical protein KDB74_01390 [Flavobacteriales bacterium]|nr:hypothetical protein [Flavobacteriales bacterium]